MKTTSDNLEIEVKFFIEDRRAIRGKLIALGATSNGEVFETNIRYEDETQSLKGKRCLLRLRKDHQAHLTVKTDPGAGDSEFKIFKELEVLVSDFDTMDRILITLGFHQAQVYEKRRETILLDNVTFCLDTLPFGMFLEIEGGREEIKSAAAALNLDWSRRIVSNYLEMFEHIRIAEGLGFTDATFANFTSHPVRFHAYREIFAAGRAVL